MTAVAIDPPARSHFVLLSVGFLSVYFALQIVLRLLSVSSVSLDDSEMVVITQALAPGYGSQPPLYNWIQIAAFGISGFGAPAIVITHFLLLWITFVFVFLSGRMIFDDDLKAALVSFALFTIPQIGWEAQHSHTHTLLSLTLSAITLFVMLRLIRTGSWWTYTGLGLCIALGSLSKYNYVPFALALLIAALTIPALRPRVLSPRMAAALVFALLLLVPHFYWVWTHLPETLSRISKFKIADDTGILEAWGRGLFAALKGIASYAAVPVLAFAFAAFVPFKEPPANADRPEAGTPGLQDGRRFILRLLPISLALILIAVLASRATEVRERWLQPILFVLPLALCALLEDRLTRPRTALLAAISAVIGVASAAGLAVAYLAPDLSGHLLRASTPFRAIAADIRQLGYDKGYILSDDHFVAGNLKLNFPHSTAAETEYGLWPTTGATTPVLLAWAARAPQPPPSLRQLWRKLCGGDAGGKVDGTLLSAPYDHSVRFRYSLNVALMPTCSAPQPP
jgi:hypothetical protein